MTIAVGLIGAGRWAEVHKKALADVGATLTDVLVRSQTSKERVERDWAVRATTDMQTFLSYGAEAVIIASPNYLHAEHSIAALHAGKHVLVEKPMAIKLEDCAAMLTAAQNADKVLAVGLEMRVFTLFSRIKDIIDSGIIGKPLYLNLDLWRRPYRSGASGWKTDPEKLGSSILEEPIHYLDLARWYFEGVGEPLSVQAWANSQPGREHFNENLDVRLAFPDKAQALITRSIAAYGHHIGLKLVCEGGAIRAAWNGSMDLDPSPHVVLTLHMPEETTAVDVTRYTGHAFDVPKQTRAFLEAIKQGKKPPATGQDGRASVALCLAVEQSLEQQNKKVII